MALLNEHLTVWEIGFRWANYDPDETRLRIPLEVRDNFRILIDAIRDGTLLCWTLAFEKWNPKSGNPPEFYIRHHLPSVEACIAGTSFDRKLLKWAIVDRMGMHSWCEARGVPLPEFWFPRGWKLEYEYPETEDEADEGEAAVETAPLESVEERKLRITDRYRAHMACQQVAKAIWAAYPTLTIKEVAIRREIQELAGGDRYELETVQLWIRDFDPRDPSIKRGRKRKNNPGPDNPDNP